MTGCERTGRCHRRKSCRELRPQSPHQDQLREIVVVALGRGAPRRVQVREGCGGLASTWQIIDYSARLGYQLTSPRSPPWTTNSTDWMDSQSIQKASTATRQQVSVFRGPLHSGVNSQWKSTLLRQSATFRWLGCASPAHGCGPAHKRNPAREWSLGPGRRQGVNCTRQLPVPAMARSSFRAACEPDAFVRGPIP